MKKLHTFGIWERPLAGLYKSRLEQEGIACLLKNDDLVSVMGEVPMVDIYPELWVIDSEAWPRAQLLLTAWMKESAGSAAIWVCPNCQEQVEAGFSACWNCDCPRPAESAERD